MDSSSWPSYSKIDPDFEAVSRHLPYIPVAQDQNSAKLLPHLPPSKSFADHGSATALRTAIAAQVEQMVSSGIVKIPDWTGVSKKDIQVPVRDGTSIRAVVYSPENVTPGPLAVYFHGGGWTFGWPEAWEHGISVLVNSLGCTVVGVAYRLAPEHRFPTAVYDACDSLTWCTQNAETLGADPGKGVIVLGTSAGANIGAAAVHDAVERKLMPKVKGVVLMGAGLVHQDALPEEWKKHHTSWTQNSDVPVLDTRAVEWFLEQYQPVPDSPYASALLWPGGHEGQPPTYMQAMGYVFCVCWGFWCFFD